MRNFRTGASLAFVAALAVSTGVSAGVSTRAMAQEPGPDAGPSQPESRDAGTDDVTGPGNAEVADTPWSTISFITPRGEPVTLRIPSRSQSIGSPTAGSLSKGRCIGAEGPGFIHTNDASCGTDETVMLVLFATGELLRDYPNSARVVIGALSAGEGGPLNPHRSHQSGRDVDIGFFSAGNTTLRTFGDLEPARIDFEKTLTLLVNLISTGRVQFIFINYALQPYFIDAAKAMGYDAQQIEYLFQYPRGKRENAGVIRHSEGHLRHAHVRFTCPENDSRCTN